MIRRGALIVGLAQTALVAGFGVGLVRGWFPLGVPGEWEWLRIPPGIRGNPPGLILAGLAILGFAGFAALGARALRRAGSRGREAAWVAGLAVASVLVQGLVSEGAPHGYGLARWVLALQNSGSSGYQQVARTEMPLGLAAFLRDYPSWVERQDSLHIGTHPPGLFVAARLLRDLMRTRPDLATWVVAHAPGSARDALRASREAGLLDQADGAALLLTGALTLLLAALAVVPLHLLARATGPSDLAWGVAALWPLLPAELMFQPTADTAFPFLSVAALALAAWSVVPGAGRIGSRSGAFGAGLVLAVGMGFTLAFLAVGLVVAVVLLATPGPADRRRRLGLIGATALGFGLVTVAWGLATGANPLAIWWTNQAHHARFYRDYPRSRADWAVANVAESVVAVGLASSAWAALGLGRPRTIPVAAWATLAVLAVLTASGRSLSEVGRLWLPMYPAIVLCAGAGWHRLGGGAGTLAATVVLLGAQGLILLATIQVVYPV